VRGGGWGGGVVLHVWDRTIVLTRVLLLGKEIQEVSNGCFLFDIVCLSVSWWTQDMRKFSFSM
jgi:hypothetical protein